MVYSEHRRTGKADEHHSVFNCFSGAERLQKVLAKCIWWERTTVAIIYHLFHSSSETSCVPFPPQRYAAPNRGGRNRDTMTNTATSFDYSKNRQCGVYSCVVWEATTSRHHFSPIQRPLGNFSILNALLPCTFPSSLEMTFFKHYCLKRFGPPDSSSQARTKPTAAKHRPASTVLQEAWKSVIVPHLFSATQSKRLGLQSQITNDKTVHTHIFNSSEESTTETEEAAIAADPIQGCKTKPTGRKTPRKRKQQWVQGSYNSVIHILTHMTSHGLSDFSGTSIC